MGDVALFCGGPTSVDGVFDTGVSVEVVICVTFCIGANAIVTSSRAVCEDAFVARFPATGCAVFYASPVIEVVSGVA